MMKQRYTLIVNGTMREADAGPHESLLEVLREHLRLTGSKIGCNEAECGSCAVMVNGKPVLSCLTLIGDAKDKEILTVEGLVSGGRTLMRYRPK